MCLTLPCLLPSANNILTHTPTPQAQLPGDDPSYKLAWTLDAAIANRQLTVRHLGELARTMAKHLQVCLFDCCCLCLLYLLHMFAHVFAHVFVRAVLRYVVLCLCCAV